MIGMDGKEKTIEGLIDELIKNKPERLNPLNDFLFKKMFGEKGCEHRLLPLVNAVLTGSGRRPLESLTISGSVTVPGVTPRSKSGIADVIATSDNRTTVNVEAQDRQQTFIISRSHFYTSSLYMESIHAGDKTYTADKVIAVDLLGFAIPDQRFSSRFNQTIVSTLEGDSGHIIAELPEIHLLQIPLFAELVEKPDLKDSLHCLMVFLQKNPQKEVLNEVIKMNGYLQSAENMMTAILADPRAYARYVRAEADELFAKAELNYARDSGREEGRAEGIELGVEKGAYGVKARVAELIASGASQEEILQSLGISPQDVIPDRPSRPKP